MVVLIATMMCALGVNAQEAYACYTSSNTTLTFYYDNLRSSRDGTTYNLNTEAVYPVWAESETRPSVTRVVFDPSFAGARPTTTYGWFNGMTTIKSIEGLNYLNTSEVTDMQRMFFGCNNLEVLDLSSFNTSKVTDMSYMFSNSSGLKVLDLTSFNTSKVTRMVQMFRDCTSLQTIYVLDGWTTNAVTSSSSMFKECTSLVGGQGTTYNAIQTDKEYAHIDGLNGKGYFTVPINREAYACYTTTDKTLSFYYDRMRSFRSGTTYDLNTEDNYPGWYNSNIKANLTKVVFDPSFAGARPTTTYCWFREMVNLQSIEGMSYLNTNQVTRTSGMFRGCSSLTSLDLSHFNTPNVTIMGSMFMDCSNLTSLDLSSFNTTKTTNMFQMFRGCSSLQTIIVSSNWTTADVTSSEDMFTDCTHIVGGKGTGYDANNRDKTYAHIDYGSRNPGYLTAQVEAYATILTGTDTSVATLTFYYDNQRNYRSGTSYTLNKSTYDPSWNSDENYSSVIKVVFSPSFADARPTSTHAWFKNMQKLETIEGIRYLNTSEVVYMDYMFFNCKKLTTLNLGYFNTTEVVNMEYMLYGCNNLNTIIVGDDWNTDRVGASGYMFYGCTSLVGGQNTTYDANHVNKAYAHIDYGTSNPGYFTEREPEAYAYYSPSNTTLTFYYDNHRNNSVTTYDLNTGNFQPGWYTDGTYSNVTKVVFAPSFAGARPTTTCYWFANMKNLQSIKGINYLNTSVVTNMSFMFYGCTKLTSLDLSRFNTSQVRTMYGMFNGCKGLTSLDLSSFNTSQVTDMSFMFYSCNNLRTIYVGDGWTTASVTYSTIMFAVCTSLVGGQGTVYDADHVDKEYAHIDGGTDNPGYFTEAGIETYACYTSADKTLTFYHDKLRSSRPGKTYDLNTGNSIPDWYTDYTWSEVTRVVFDPLFAGARPTSTFGWFCQMENLQSIEGMSYLNTSEVTDMSFMFYNCSNMTDLNLRHFNTAKVTNMERMFNNCTSLTSLNLSSFNTSMVNLMNCMFWNCSNLKTIYVGDGWNTYAVTSSISMFYNCTSLVGGQGTVYDANHIDKTFAHIDEGSSFPGYFTALPDGITTGLENGQRDAVKGQRDEWFTLDGQKLSGKPTKKGVYIVNGRAVVR